MVQLTYSCYYKFVQYKQIWPVSEDSSIDLLFEFTSRYQDLIICCLLNILRQGGQQSALQNVKQNILFGLKHLYFDTIMNFEGTYNFTPLNSSILWSCLAISICAPSIVTLLSSLELLLKNEFSCISSSNLYFSNCDIYLNMSFDWFLVFSHWFLYFAAFVSIYIHKSTNCSVCFSCLLPF